eukprot:TRINITY_DN4080_c0_g1_i1.p1 TRINITY_DN4080_c0_g1~~TRINITY_DN4080_c0_g1_i1.p1  ORF type:complete len:310 (+),score=33.52 TRINITY_DN4080_c0_g1_i1:119-1048(+)
MPKVKASPTPAVVVEEIAPSKDRLKQFEKTKLCKFYILGQCARGSACRYAHASAEIKPLPDLACTKLCPKLVSLGSCENPDCMYAHHRDELRGTSIYHKTKICRFAQTGQCTLGSKCNFAHSDREIRKARSRDERYTPVLASKASPLHRNFVARNRSCKSSVGAAVNLNSELGLPPGLPAPPQVSFGDSGGLGIFSDGRSTFSFSGSLSSACSSKPMYPYEPAYVPLVADDGCTAEFRDAASSLKNSLVVDQSNHAWQVTQALWDAPLPSSIRAVRTSQSTLCTLGECEVGPEQREILSVAEVTSWQAG